LKAPLPGLKFSAQGEAEIVTQLFSCCEGGGFYYHRLQGSYSRCQLLARLQKVNRITQLFKKIWAQAWVGLGKNSGVLANGDEFLPWLLKFREQHELRGKVITLGSSLDQPSYGLWLMALMTIWRTGLDVHVVSLGKSSDGELLPAGNFATENRGIVFVEQKAPLWQARAAFDMDVVINWCEGAAVPLWFDLSSDGVKSQPTDNAMRSDFSLDHGFAKKLAKTAARPPLAWLGIECCSRLRMLCGGSEQFM
jgi:hypothetical protein